MTSHDHFTVIRISRLAWFGLAVLVLAPWGMVLWLARAPAIVPPPVAAPAGRTIASPGANGGNGSATAGTMERGKPGPWGQIESSRIFIEPPEDFIPAFFTSPQPLRWTFRAATPASLAALWEQAGLSTAQRQVLEEPARRIVRSDAIVIVPPADLVLGLAPAARAILYAALAPVPENIPQHDPFRVRAETVDDWFDDTQLPDDIIALTRRLLYRRESNLLFSDHDLVLPRLASASDRVRFIKTLSRKTALLVQLHVAHGADVDALTRYWGTGRRSKDVRPLLQSLAHQPRGGSVDLVHLLPPFARSLLYTYPVPSGHASDASRDCHWTSLNFYNERPDNRFADLQIVQQTLLNDYYLASGEPALGDIILLVESGGRGVHSCVYVADNIVFTKNGAAFSVPWLLSRLENVISFYSLTEPVEVRRYRAREK